MKKIFITGGAGYIGARLTPYLLKKKFKVTVYDTFYFGNTLPRNKNLTIVKGDIRNTKKLKKVVKTTTYFFIWLVFQMT